MTIKTIIGRVALPLAATLGLAQPALAAGSSSSAASSKEIVVRAKPARPDTKYCARYEIPNSRIVASSCRTEQEWDRQGYDLDFR
ncbi:MAG TPA: hypothetical protein VGB48_06830 [Allosphingosinicella sp.]|jgi:hypothetical protein